MEAILYSFQHANLLFLIPSDHAFTCSALQRVQASSYSHLPSTAASYKEGYR